MQEIRDRTGAQISIKNNHAYLRGTPEQCNTARELIEKILKVKEFMTIYESDFYSGNVTSLFIEQQFAKKMTKLPIVKSVRS